MHLRFLVITLGTLLRRLPLRETVWTMFAQAVSIRTALRLAAADVAFDFWTFTLHVVGHLVGSEDHKTILEFS